MGDGDNTYQGLLGEAHRCRDQGRLPEAIEAYRKLLSRWPQSPDCWYNLALLQRRVGQYEQALASYQQALDRGVTRPEEVHLNRGVIFADDLHRPGDAERELAAALRLNPGYLPGLLNLANLQEDLGRRDAAADAYQRILALDPDHLEALARYANLRPFADAADPLISRLRSALDRTDADAAGRASIGFALGRALDSCGEYAAAFDVYIRANRLSRESVGPAFTPYDASAEAGLIDRIMTAFPAAGAVDDPRSRPDTRTPCPIFICGMFRSGSTLLEQLLAGHPRITAGGELNLVPQIAEHILRPYPENAAAAPPARLQALAAEYRRSLAARFPGAELVTDKRPDNFLYVGLIKRLFPEAKIVHTTRDALDNCLSVFFLHLDQRMSYALSLMDTGHYYVQYRRLMAHWKLLYGGDIIDVSYDALVQDSRPVMARLLNSLGLEWDERCLEVQPDSRFVRTASVWQVREPLYQHSSGRARHYEPQLSALREYLARSTCGV